MEEDNTQYQAKLAYHDVELENGIFNYVITLCHAKADKVGLKQAKEEVAVWLESLVAGLRKE